MEVSGQLNVPDTSAPGKGPSIPIGQYF